MKGNPEALGALLRRLVDEDELAFDRLFDAAGARTRVALAPELAAPLREAGFVEGEDEQLWGLLRARRLGRRFYFLEIGEGEQYHQDVWPETDALLDSIDGVGRCLDVGTGCGIIAIEAAARGHSVVATDLYESAIELARFNSRLNGVDGIDFRVGHLFVPVAGERFDLVLTAPHYGRVFNQLRLEVLRASLDHLTPGGRLFLATALEWEEGAPLGVESVLRPLSAQGAGVRVRPIVSRQRSWFTFQQSDGQVPRLGSRHRFLVEIDAGGSGLEMEWPPADSQPTHQVVPLSRLKQGAVAAVVAADDAALLGSILERLALPSARFAEVLPSSLLDACRWGARPCVGPHSAAGALVDVEGAVRPCTNGAAVGRVEDSFSTMIERLERLGDEASARRGCPECPARAVCSRCLFPAVLDDGAYCTLIRAHAPALPRLHRLLAIAARLDGLAAPVELEQWPRAVGAEPAWPALTERWRQREVWILRDGERLSFWWLASGRPAGSEVDAQVGWLGRLVGDGADLSTVESSSKGQGVPPRRLRSLVERLAAMLGVDPTFVAGRTS